MTTLAQQLTSHPNFRWEPGMRSRNGFRIINNLGDGGILLTACMEGGDRYQWAPDAYRVIGPDVNPRWRPIDEIGRPPDEADLDDPATASLLLRKAMESGFSAWPNPWTFELARQIREHHEDLGTAAAKALINLWKENP